MTKKTYTYWFTLDAGEGKPKLRSNADGSYTLVFGDGEEGRSFTRSEFCMAVVAWEEECRRASG